MGLQPSTYRALIGLQRPKWGAPPLLGRECWAGVLLGGCWVGVGCSCWVGVGWELKVGAVGGGYTWGVESLGWWERGAI